MFAFDTAIEAVQTAKKEAVKTFVKNEAIAKSLTEIVDAQTEYAKSAVKSSTEIATKVGAEMVKAAQEAAKFDYAKHTTELFETMTKPFQTASKK